MLYYRYRPGSEISFKELLYNEIYFGSQEECNDPYDCKVFYEFPQDRIRWKRLLEQTLQIDDAVFKSMLINRLTKHICAKPPTTLESLMTIPFLNNFPLNNEMQESTLINMEEAIRRFIKIYIPATQYFACFSTTPSQVSMWSHYANNHRGFCLIFKAINNKLQQSNAYSQKQIRRETPNGLAQNMSYAMPKEFTFQAVDYRKKVEPLNAFKCLSQFIYGDEVDDKKRDELWQEQYSHFLQKELSWQNEMESRLILSPPPSWLFGKHIPYTNHERLFHYQPTQLVGIITGARISENDRNRILEIVTEKKEQTYLAKKPYILFDFVTFEARLSTEQRIIEIHPTHILGATSLKPGDKGFDDRLSQWEKGWGLAFHEGGACRKVQVD